MKTHYPGLYERIVAKAALGQFIPVGGTWVEMVRGSKGKGHRKRRRREGKRGCIKRMEGKRPVYINSKIVCLSVTGWQHPKWRIICETVSNWSEVFQGGVWAVLQGGKLTV